MSLNIDFNPFNSCLAKRKQPFYVKLDIFKCSLELPKDMFQDSIFSV